MNTVQPIRDKRIVNDIADYLYTKDLGKQNEKRDYVMYMTGIYSGIRISDILLFRVRDVRNALRLIEILRRSLKIILSGEETMNICSEEMES